MLLLMGGLDPARWDATLVYHPSTGIEPLVERAAGLGASLWPVAPMPLGFAGARRLPLFASELRRRQPAVFHAHLTWPLACKFALAAAVLARIPAVVATHQLFFDIAFTKATLAQQRLLARGVDRYLAVSEHTADRLEHGLGLPAERVQVVPNPVDVDAYDAAILQPPVEALNGDNELPVVLCAARLHEQKGHRFLIDAIPAVPNARFVFAGGGPERGALEAQSRALGVAERVLFLGARSDVPALLRGCDVFVLPSLYEGLPLAVLEAMASRKPVVATRIGGTDETVVDGKTGFLVPVRDPSALAAAINALLEDPERARAMGAAGRARVARQFSSKRIVAGVTGVYGEILRGSDAGLR